MKSIYNTTDNSELIQRINQLNLNSKAQWGKMSVDQMLKHTNAASEVVFGKQELKISFLMKLVGKLMKNKVFNSEFKKNSPTAPSFIRTGKYSFETTKEELIERVEKFATEGQAVIKNQTHPFFGKMTYEEWDKIHYMHLDHHLRQFGV